MITTNVIFSHKAGKEKKARGYLEIRITYNRKSYYINTGIKVARSEWQYGAVVDRTDKKELNERLAILVARAENAINYYLKTQTPIDIEQVRNRVNMMREDSEDAPFLDWLSEQIQKCTLSARTKKNYKSLLARLVEFDKLKKWQDITTETILDFNTWLYQRDLPLTYNQTLAGVESRHMSESGVYNYHKSLKKMLYLAVKLHKIEQNPYTSLRGEFPKGEHENVEYLTDDEIDRIITHPIEGTTARPYYDVDFIGGFDLMMNDQTTNPTYLIDCSPYNKEGVIWCNLSGHSMEPAINHGDIIALREVQDWQTFLSFGEIYGIVTDNDLRTVKIIRKGSDSEHFRLVPINTAEYDEQEIPTEHISRIYQILGSIKKF